MKHFLEHIDKIFENKIRLGAMSALAVNESMDFNTLKDLMDVTDGNLASHLKALEKAEYITVHKEFVGRKPKTSYAMTQKGKIAFEKHIDNLQKLIQSGRNQ